MNLLREYIRGLLTEKASFKHKGSSELLSELTYLASDTLKEVKT